MKYLIFISSVLSVGLIACNESSANNKDLQTRIDSLEKKLAGAYKPGFGEFMSGIQVHHIKLWFAGQNQNWELAEFEIHEIKETLEAIQDYCADRPEAKAISMIDSSLNSVNQAIQQKGPVSFKNSYVLLTNTCNRCHQETQHGFNLIKIPDTPPYSNQDFILR